MSSLHTYLVLHILLGSFGGRGENFVDESVRVCVEGGGEVCITCNSPVRLVCQRLMLNFHQLTVVSCILNHDWLLLLSITLCPAQYHQGVY